jgi:hypothetical protein
MTDVPSDPLAPASLPPGATPATSVIDPPRHRKVKVFDVSVAPAAETLAFALRFTIEATGQTEEHTFEAQRDAGAGGTFAISGIVRYTDRGEQIIDLNAMTSFFKRVLIPGDYDRLRDLMDRRDLTVPMDKLGEVFQWLMEEISGRPTEPPPR